MPTNANRPFLSSFLAAFRAQSAYQGAATSPSTGSTAHKPSSSASYSTAAAASTSSSSAPPYDNSLTAKPSANSAASSTGATTTAVRDAAATTSSSSNAAAAATQTPFSPTRGPSHHQPYNSAKTPGSPGSPGSPNNGYGGSNYNAGGYPIPGGSSSRHRRGSDSSSDGGFRERTGSSGGHGAGAGAGMEKWYIGGRTPGGEERFYKLGMVRRMRSSDRLSLDRLSL